MHGGSAVVAPGMGAAASASETPRTAVRMARARRREEELTGEKLTAGER